MAESTNERIERLLSDGLDSYGNDDIGKAILAWEEVLVLDPENEEARDYIQTADRRNFPRGPKPAARSVQGILEEAHDRIRNDDYEGALNFLSSASQADRTSLEIQATVELVRSQLFKHYRARVGALDSVPVLVADGAAITKFNLPPDAGFVLSLVDGSTPVSDMISVSGLDPFDALRILQGLLDAKIVSMRT